MSTKWEEIPFLDAFETSPKNTQTLPRSAYKKQGKFPVVDQSDGLIGGWTDDLALVKTFDRPVVVFGDHTRCLKFVDFPFAPGADGTKVLIPAPFLDPRFAFYQLLASPVEVKGYARHFGELKKRHIKVPPLAEQQRIVAKLDTFADLLSKLESCCEQTRADVADLFITALRGQLAGKSAWPTKPLGDFCEIYQPQTIGMKDLVPDGRYQVYGANGPIGLYDSFNHENSEVTVTCRGATCGTVNVTPPEVWITGNAMVVRPDESVMTKEMLRYVLEGLDFTEVITGAAQPQITKQNLAPTLVGVPPIVDQARIVERLEEIREATNEIAIITEAKYRAAVDLRQSILEAAFRGEL